MFKYIKSFFVALNANAHPGDIGHAVSLGLLLAFVPKANLLWVCLFFLTLFIRSNKGAFFLSFILLSFVVPFVDVPVERLGFAILSLKFLEPFFAFLEAIPFVGLTRFNNTMVTGGLAAGIITYVPVYFLFRFLIVKYRNVLQPKIVNSKAYKVFLNLPIIKQIVAAGTIAEGFMK